MTTIVEVKINSPEDMVTFGTAVTASTFEFDYAQCSSSYGYSTVTYQCSRKDISKIKEYWKGLFQNCRIVSY
jgi:hypothetical protein